MKFQIINVSDIEGFKLGNAEDLKAGTGCTVIISEEGALAGVDVRGGAPATRETDLLKSENTVQKINAVVITGGSAFGLESASGVMNYLDEKNIGLKASGINVPIVCSASLFDLNVGSKFVRPDIEMGKRAVENAYMNEFKSGNFGAGTGTTVGKIYGIERSMKTGLGTFACQIDNLQIGAITAVNAVGDIYDDNNKIIAGPLSEDKTEILSTIMAHKERILGINNNSNANIDISGNGQLEKSFLENDISEKNFLQNDFSESENLEKNTLENYNLEKENLEINNTQKDNNDDSNNIKRANVLDKKIADEILRIEGRNGEGILPIPDNNKPNEIKILEGDSLFGDEDDMIFNTTISCLITNAKLTKVQANKLSSILHDAYARAIKPVHSSLDGDTIFVMTTGKVEADFDSLAALSTDILQYAIINSARNAEPAYGLKSASSFENNRGKNE